MVSSIIFMVFFGANLFPKEKKNQMNLGFRIRKFYDNNLLYFIYDFLKKKRYINQNLIIFEIIKINKIMNKIIN